MSPDRVSVQKARLHPMRRINLAMIALGGNWPSHIGVPNLTIVSAIGDIAQEIGPIVAVSRFFRTPAHPLGSGPEFVNAAALVETGRRPQAILQSLHEIEARHGRVRKKRWGPRTLDLDLLGIGEKILPDSITSRHWMALSPDRQQIEVPDELILPHPRLQDRAFVLIPLAEIAPGWRHPQIGKTVAEMAAALPAEERAAICPPAPGNLFLSRENGTHT